jgi:catechol 2,3-dioxygenase-like lactoylglutathione lyase family enzyme
MFSHITLGTNDIRKAAEFYDAVLAPLGLKRTFSEIDDGIIAYGPANQPPQFFICTPFNEQAASVGNGTHVALMAPTRAAIDAFHKTAVEAGGTDEGAPGPRPQYHEHYYGAYIRDPDGNKLQACCHVPEG